jgi:hypothetical protein
VTPRGSEQPGSTAEKQGIEGRAAQNPAQRSGDPDLQAVIDAWPTLTPHKRAAVLSIVQGACEVAAAGRLTATAATVGLGEAQCGQSPGAVVEAKPMLPSPPPRQTAKGVEVKGAFNRNRGRKCPQGGGSLATGVTAKALLSRSVLKHRKRRGRSVGQ